MIHLKSFKMSDEKGMNDALSQYTLSKGAAVFISNGEVVLQLDNGLPMTTTQRIVIEKEARHGLAMTLDPILHTMKVLTHEMDDIKSQLSKLESDIVTPNSKVVYQAEKEKKSIKEHLENVLLAKQNQYVTNKGEVDRIKVNLTVYDETIAELEVTHTK